MHQDGAKVGEAEPGGLPPVLRLRWRLVKAAYRNDLVGTANGHAVGIDDVICGLARVNLPVPVVALRPEVEGLAGDDDLEPVPLIGERQVPKESETGPARREHRAAQVVITKASYLVDHVPPF